MLGHTSIASPRGILCLRLSQPPAGRSTPTDTPRLGGAKESTGQTFIPGHWFWRRWILSTGCSCRRRRCRCCCYCYCAHAGAGGRKMDSVFACSEETPRDGSMHIHTTIVFAEAATARPLGFQLISVTQDSHPKWSWSTQVQTSHANPIPHIPQASTPNRSGLRLKRILFASRMTRDCHDVIGSAYVYKRQ